MKHDLHTIMSYGFHLSACITSHYSTGPPSEGNLFFGRIKFNTKNNGPNLGGPFASVFLRACDTTVMLLLPRSGNVFRALLTPLFFLIQLCLP